RIAADDRATVVFEAPGRLGATLRDLAAACGTDRRAAVCRELTKLHEQVARGTLGELAAQVGPGIPERGRIAIVIAGSDHSAGAPASGSASLDLAAARVQVRALIGEGVRPSEAARRVADETGLPRRELYRTDQ